jgi:DNA-3-methyladenine glycosylase
MSHDGKKPASAGFFPIPQRFYLRPAAEVAADLLGCLLRRDGVTLVVTEVEVYGGPEDTASHCRFGRTARNAPMWGVGGHCYVYLCYGVHWMLNIVTGDEGEGAAVLVRSGEVADGLQIVLGRRFGARRLSHGGRRDKAICHGPGKVAQALSVDGSFNGHALFETGGLELCEGRPPASIERAKRVGIDFAEAKDRDALLRFKMS